MFAYLQRGGQLVLNFLTPKKKLGWISYIFLSVAILTGFLVTTPFAHASQPWDTVASILASLCLMIASLFLKLTIFLLTFIIEIAAYNGYLDSTAVNYGWVMVRDVTNMGFVVIRLVLAVGTILGLEQYEWKKLMVKFVMAAILVNFSRVICGVIIDIGQVVMVTFINGVAATAGGNLITMFNADKIMSLTGDTSQEVNGTEVLMASVAAVGFSAMMMAVMFVFLIILMYRMLSLWILIVLSPIAFVTSVVPATQSYASEWWKEFGNNVISGPLAAFFLWLAFVTVGGGNINDEVSGASQTDVKVSKSGEADNIGQESAGIGEAMQWDKMANFAIAIGMLMVGAERVQKLGVKGGEMMGKAVDFGKKAIAIGSGAAAGMWAAKGIAKGATKASKWGLMNMPLVGGNAWVTRGKAIAGRVGQKFEHFQMGRDRLAKKLEEDKKKIDDAKFKARTGQALTKEESALLAAEKNKSTGTKLWRGLKAGLLASVVETQGRGMKRGDDWMEAYTAAHENRQGEYSVSSTPSGYAKLEELTKGEMIKAKSTSKKKRKVEALSAGYLDREREQRGEMTARLAAVVAASAQAKAAGDIPGQISSNKERERLELEIKDFDRRSVARATAVAAIQGKTEEEGRKVSTIAMDRTILETATGAALYKSTARAKLAGEGFRADEEEETMAAEIQIMEEEAAQLAAVGKTEELAGLEERIKAMRRAAGLLASKPGELVGTRADAEANLEAAKKRHLDATTKRTQLEDDFEKNIRHNPSKTAAEKEEARKNIDAAKAEEKEEAGKVALAAEEVKKFDQLDGLNQTFDPGQMEKMIAALKKATESGSEADKDQVKKALQGDSGMNAAFLSMFGTRRVEDVLMDKRNLEALKHIEAAIKNPALKGKSNAEAQDIMRGTVQGDIRTSNTELSGAWKQASKTAPSIYAARSAALRDHTYAFYRGKKQEMKDNASQAEIWDKMGIETPSGAAQEAVAEELYGKNFKSMNYDQIMAAQKAHKEYMGKKKPEEITDRDRLIGLAIMNKLFDESWVDDSEMAVKGKVRTRDIESYAKSMGIDMHQFENRKKRVGRSGGNNVRLSKDNINRLSVGVGKLNGLDASFIDSIRKNEKIALDKFMTDFKRQIESSPIDFDGKSPEEVLKIIQHSESDQLNELLDAVKRAGGK